MTTVLTKLALFTKTFAASIVAAVLYGLIHDQITIRICPQYFTVWHPHLIDTNSLTVLAVFWGVIATWWMGAFLGIVLGWSAVVGQRPMAPFKDVLNGLARIMAITACGASIAGLVAALSHLTVPATVMGPDICTMSLDIQRRFTIDLFIHNASYNISPVATAVYAALIYRKRMQASKGEG